MPSLLELCRALSHSAFGTSLRESEVVFPLVETVHVLALALLVGTVVLLDLRLWSVIFRKQPVSQVAGQLLPLTWAGFGVACVSGALLFAAEADKMYVNPAFRWKLLFLTLAGLNPLVFHCTVYRRVATWETAPVTPLQARTAGLLSILLWSGVIITGRVIAYF